MQKGSRMPQLNSTDHWTLSCVYIYIVERKAYKGFFWPPKWQLLPCPAVSCWLVHWEREVSRDVVVVGGQAPGRQRTLYQVKPVRWSLELTWLLQNLEGQNHSGLLQKTTLTTLITTKWVHGDTGHVSIMCWDYDYYYHHMRSRYSCPWQTHSWVRIVLYQAILSRKNEIFTQRGLSTHIVATFQILYTIARSFIVCTQCRYMYVYTYMSILCDRLDGFCLIQVLREGPLPLNNWMYW